MFSVLIWMNSWWGCFRPPWGGTFTTFPSSILRSACCTPSPDTVTGNRWVDVFSGDLVYFVDVNDAPLCAGNVSTCCLQKPQKNVLNVFADVTRLGDRSCIDNRERNLQNLSHDLRQVGFAATRRPHQHDVGLLKFYVVLFVALLARQQPLVVVVNTDAENLLRLILSDHELLELFVDLYRFGGVDVRCLGFGFGVGSRGLRSLPNDPPTPLHALIADKDAVRTGNEHADLLLLLLTERATFCTRPLCIEFLSPLPFIQSIRLRHADDPNVDFRRRALSRSRF